MTTISSPASRNPLLREADRVSPAVSLDLAIGYDGEGWPIIETFSVGQIVVSLNGNLYKVIGFSLDNDIFAMPYGLGHDKAIAFVTFLAEGLRGYELPITDNCL